MVGRVLIVTTSHDKLGDTGKPAGSWVEEVASPYYAWRKKGYEAVETHVRKAHSHKCASAGGKIPFDPASEEGDFKTPEAGTFMEDKEAQELVNNSKSVTEVTEGAAEHYDAIFLPGGHGIATRWDEDAMYVMLRFLQQLKAHLEDRPLFDGPTSKELKQLVEAFWNGGKIVSAVCHGPNGLVSATGPDGNPIVKGKRVTGFANTEEVAVAKDKAVPFLLEDKLKELGGIFSKADADWASHVVSDGNLITGQNPGSSKAVADAVIAAISSR
ncbi:hypothetical protein N2152v2_003185 [Parachlorella kessleri]